MKGIVFIALAALLVLSFVHFNKPMETQEKASLQSHSGIPSEIVARFKSWKKLYGKHYSAHEDEGFRLNIFFENAILIESENARQSEYVLDENQFMDLTQAEFVATYLGLVVPEGQSAPNMDVDNIIDDVVPNEAFSWVTEGAVGPVKNQGSCGSCWAFSATGVVEGYWKLYEGELPNVSEQQLVDCSTSYGNLGCNGGWPASALQYVKDHGLVKNSEYPYTATDGSCRINQGPYTVESVEESASCGTLTDDVKQQPTSVAVDASNWSFYRSGVFSNCAKSVNHGVLVVGWDAQGNWIIKNSWGTSWGQNGYMTLKTGDTCAVCQYMANSWK